jgi:hypothetical protein
VKRHGSALVERASGIAVVALVMMAQTILAVAKTSGLYGAGQDLIFPDIT